MGAFMTLHGSVIAILVGVVAVAGWMIDRITERDIVIRSAESLDREGICCSGVDE